MPDLRNVGSNAVLYCGNCSNLFPEQRQVLLQTPLLLSALLNVCIARTWLSPTLAVMRLHSSVAQAIPPNASDRLHLTQLPGISFKDLEKLPAKASMVDLLHSLEEKKDPRLNNVRRTLEKWGRVEIVEATFRGKPLFLIMPDLYSRSIVIGETIVTPSAIVYLLVKLRMMPPGSRPADTKELTVDETKRLVQRNHEIDEKFLESRSEAEGMDTWKANESAHAPHWPAVGSISELH